MKIEFKLAWGWENLEYKGKRNINNTSFPHTIFETQKLER
jgi:hypothetical protein